MRGRVARVTAISLGVVGILGLSGCAFGYDVVEPTFEVMNLTGSPLLLRPLDGSSFRRDAPPAEIIHLEVSEEGCGSHGWIATTPSGNAVAQVSGGCPGHRWTIRGINDSTYE